MSEETKVLQQIMEIPLDQLRSSPKNRKIGGLGNISELAVSISQLGVLQPILVRPVADKNNVPFYEIVSGERRWEASKIAGLTTIPVIVDRLDDTMAEVIQLVENLQREDVHPLDETAGIARLTKMGLTQSEIATRLGKSPKHIAQVTQLQNLTKVAAKLFKEGKIGLGHALLLARLSTDQQENIIGEDLFDGDGDVLSVSELDNFIRHEVMNELSAAAFPKDMALGEFPPCLGCPKHSGAAPLLFDDLGKRDMCLDENCFHGKVQAWIEICKKRLDESKQKYILSTSNWYSGDDKIKSRNDWKECKKGDEGAVPVLIVDGSDAGKMVYGKIPEKVKQEDSQKAKVREANKKIKDEGARRVKFFEQLVEKVQMMALDDVEFFKLVAKMLWKRAGSDQRRLLAKTFGLEKDPDVSYSVYDKAIATWIEDTDPLVAIVTWLTVEGTMCRESYPYFNESLAEFLKYFELANDSIIWPEGKPKTWEEQRAERDAAGAESLDGEDDGSAVEDEEDGYDEESELAGEDEYINDPSEHGDPDFEEHNSESGTVDPKGEEDEQRSILDGADC